VNPGDDFDQVTNLSTAASGTQYFVNTSGVVTVSADGLATASATGSATVTIINGSAEAVVPVLVQVPQTGTVALGAAGGVVQGSDGSQVAIPPGVLPEGTTVSITPTDQASLPEAVPDGLTFGGAFNLDVGADSLSVPVQLAVKVAPGTPVGSTVYFYRAGTYLNDNGTTQPIWWQIDNGIVGADGMAHTNSPPWHGVGDSGTYLIGYSQEALAQFRLQLGRDLLAQASQGLLGLSMAIAGGGGTLVGLMAVSTDVGIRATLATPAHQFPTPIAIQVLPQVGQPQTTTVFAQLDPGKLTTFKTAPTAPTPTPAATAPFIQTIAVNTNIQSGQTRPQIIITGQHFLTTNNNAQVDPTKLIVSFPPAQRQDVHGQSTVDRHCL